MLKEMNILSTASEGEIDFSNSNIIFLTDVNATIILKNSNVITISSSYGNIIQIT